MSGTRWFLEKTAGWRCLPAIVIWAVAAGPAASHAAASELWIGAATADITPDQPVPLTGYRSVRVSQSILSRCTANVLALEARDGDKAVDQAILVACDLCVIRPALPVGLFRRRAKACG